MNEKNEKRRIGRREFFSRMAIAGAGAGLSLRVTGCEASLSENESARRPDQASDLSGRVVVIECARMRSLGDVLPVEYLQPLIEEGLKALTGREKAKEACGVFAGEGDRIGMKLNCLAGPGMSTERNLTAGVAGVFRGSGIKPENFIVWERTNRELERCGYKVGSLEDGFRVIGTDNRGVGYEKEPLVQGELCSRFSRILTRFTTVMFNLPKLKDHNLAGLSGGMKNLFGVIHNPNKMHNDNCNPYVADLTASEPVKSKLKLTVCDALSVQYHGGPAYKPKWAEPAGKILISADPAALDVVALKLLEELRKKNDLPPLKEENRYPSYIETAGRYGLGVIDPELINEKVIKG